MASGFVSLYGTHLTIGTQASTHTHCGGAGLVVWHLACLSYTYQTSTPRYQTTDAARCSQLPPGIQRSITVTQKQNSVSGQQSHTWGR